MHASARALRRGDTEAMADTARVAPRNFVVFFDEKVGSTALISVLGKLRGVSVARLDDGIVYEPFDRHRAGRLSRRELWRCLELLLGGGDMAALNRAYRPAGQGPLGALDQSGAVGLKMRFQPPWNGFRVPLANTRYGRRVQRRLHIARRRTFERRMFDLLRRHDGVAFVLVRDDLLRWALSHLHGDGTGRPGHLQFRLAVGKLSGEDIGTFRADCDRLAQIIERCRKMREAKLGLYRQLRAAGVDAHLVRYEEFLHQTHVCVERLLDCLGVESAGDEIAALLARTPEFRKVHPDRVEDFVENHEEVLARFGRFTAPAHRTRG